MKENELMDEEAKEGARGKTRPMRILWVDIVVVIPFRDGERIVDLKKFLMCKGQPMLTHTSSFATHLPRQRGPEYSLRPNKHSEHGNESNH